MSSLMESTYSCSSLAGVGVVEAQVAAAAELLGDAEVEADGLGVADVEVAVGLGGKARAHGVALAAIVRFGRAGYVPGHDLPDEVGGRPTALASPAVALSTGPGSWVVISSHL